jgi:hypothetical protein
MTVALRKMEIQRNGNKKHGVVRFTEVIIMSVNNNQKSAGYAMLGVIIVFAIIGFLVSLTEKEDPKCAFAGCDNTVSTEGGYCYQHNTPGKRRKATYGTSSSHSHSTTSSGSTSNSSGSSSNSGSSSSSYKPSSSNSKYNSSHSHDSYDSGYDDVYMDGDYDQDRYDRDDDYATGVDDAIEEDIEDGNDGDW